MAWWFGLVLLAIPAMASAGGELVPLSFRWTDMEGHAREIAVELPADDIERDRAELTRLPSDELYAHTREAVLAFARSVPSGVLVAKESEERLIIEPLVDDATARPWLERIGQVREEATDTWLAERRFRRNRSGRVTFDLASLVVDYADDVSPVAEQLRAMSGSRRRFVDLALSFVQSIPYDEEGGFHRPLALLARNSGDCDSKVVLFLALVRAAYPDIDIAVLYAPGHALAGVALPRGGSDWGIRYGGVDYLYAEPVGPTQNRLGERGQVAARTAQRAEVQPVPFPR